MPFACFFLESETIPKNLTVPVSFSRIRGQEYGLEGKLAL